MSYMYTRFTVHLADVVRMFMLDVFIQVLFIADEVQTGLGRTGR